jgi:hypothetical protein
MQKLDKNIFKKYKYIYLYTILKASVSTVVRVIFYK